MIGKHIPWSIKLALSFLLVFGTWNPLGFDLVHSLVQMDLTQLLTWFVLLLTVVIWGFALKALHEALGTVGIVVFLVLSGVLLGGMYQLGWIGDVTLKALGWYVDVIMTFLLFFGLMFPTWWRQLTGKVAIEEDFD